MLTSILNLCAILEKDYYYNKIFVYSYFIWTKNKLKPSIILLKLIFYNRFIKISEELPEINSL